MFAEAFPKNIKCHYQFTNTSVTIDLWKILSCHYFLNSNIRSTVIYLWTQGAADNFRTNTQYISFEIFFYKKVPIAILAVYQNCLQKRENFL